MTDCYIGVKACGCAVAAVVDEPAHRKDTAKTIADYVRSGLSVEKHSVEWARKNLRKCRCVARAAAPEQETT